MIVALTAAAACGGRRAAPAPAPLPPPAPPPGPPPFTATEVWTREPGVPLVSETATVPVPHTSMRLEVLRVDSARLLVRCPVCLGQPTGWVERARVVHEPLAPVDAARLELADFVLAVREAARRRDVAALRPVMSRDFVHSLEAGEGVLEALATWQRRYNADLDRLPALLDRGVVNVPGTQVWAAPPEYAAQLGYLDLRSGFRRGANGWEWIFLVRSGLR